MTQHVKSNNLSFITLKNPPVNSLNINVRIGLLKCIEEASADPDIRAIVIRGNGGTFSAGADINEFRTGAVFENYLPFVINDVEQCKKPVFALIDGNALGGGLELALGCHYRVASSRARFAFPEVKLGILPAGGGTQRLPRLVGFMHAADLICSARIMAAEEAYSKGLVDHLVSVPAEMPREKLDGFLEEKAVEYIKSRLAVDVGGRRLCDKPFKGLNEYFYGEIEKAIKSKSKGMLAPMRTFKLLKNSAGRSFSDGLDLEQRAVGELIRSSQAKALQYLFFAEKSTTKIQGIVLESVAALSSIGIVGAGTMGSGIAIVFLEANISVVLVDQTKQNLERGMALISGFYDSAIKGHKMAANVAKKRLSMLTLSLRLEDLSTADLVVEAAFEDINIKKEIMAKLDQICKKSALFCSNTSTLSIDEISSATKRPQQVMGMHFFAPANVMKLLEIVKGGKTSSDTISTGMALSKTIRKIPVLVGNGFGFVANRMLLAYMNQAFLLVLEGASPSQIDRTLCDFGFAMGPFQVCDLSGIDVIHHIKLSAEKFMSSTPHMIEGASLPDGGPKPESARSALDSIKRAFLVAGMLYEAGRLGVKTGKGFYRYEGGSRKPLVDEEVGEMISKARVKAGSVAREVFDEEILERCLYATVNEGFKCLEDGVAFQPSDIDVVWVFGFGFPPYRGGPMFFAGEAGLPVVLKRVKAFHALDKDNPYWWPSSLLEKAADSGKNIRTFFEKDHSRL